MFRSDITSTGLVDVKDDQDKYELRKNYTEESDHTFDNGSERKVARASGLLYVFTETEGEEFISGNHTLDRVSIPVGPHDQENLLKD